jgi:beta-lactamase regulating signal transducer with metallopeptidase domain
MKYELFALSERLLSGALTGLYQGLVLALIVGLTLRLLRRTNAATRHGIWFATLLLVTALMVGNCLTAVFSAPTAPLAPPTQPIAWVPFDAEAEPAQPPDELYWEDSGPQERPAQADAASQRSFEIEAPAASASLHKPLKASSPPPQTFSERIASLFGVRTAPFLSTGIPHPISWRPLAGLALPSYFGAAILCLCLCVACARMLLLAWHFYQLRRLKQTAAAPSDALLFLFNELCRRLAVRRRVTVKISAAIRSPVLLGFFNPMVLVPQPEPGMDELSQTRQVLCHELAHVRRRDDWLNLLQHCVEATMFFQPIVWWISKRLALEREIACDDLVLHQGGQRRAYALLLTELAGRLNGPRALIAPGVSASHSQLKQRINMILNTNRNISPRLAGSRAGLITSAAALLALGAFYCAPRLVLAQDAPAPPAPPIAAVPPLPPVAPMPPVPPALALVAIAGEPLGTPSADEPEQGPRFKSSDAFSLSPTPRVPPAAPMSPSGPVVACTPNVSIATSIAPHVHPAPYVALAMADSASSSDQSSIEERVERLEKMVKSLTAQQKNKRTLGDAWSWTTPTPGQPNFNMQFERSQAQMERDMARAQEQMKRAAEEMQRAAEDQELKGQMNAKEMPRKQLEALRKAREGLQKQLDALDRQIERLEGERDQPKGPKEPKEPKEGGRSRSEALPEKPSQDAVAGEVF